MALTVIRTARPNPVWQESYVRVAKGQRLIIDAEGAWSPDLQNRIGWCGADGVPKTPGSSDYLLPGTNIGALIAKIGMSSSLSAHAMTIPPPPMVSFFSQ